MVNSSWSTMKTKYLFSKQAGLIDASTLFVDVYIGRSVQDQRDLHFLQCLVERSSDYYLVRYDNSVADYLNQVETSLQDELNDHRFRLLRCMMSSAKLRRLLKSGRYDNYAQIFYSATLGCRRMSFSANSVYHCAINRADASILQSAHVKNLSQERRSA